MRTVLALLGSAALVAADVATGWNASADVRTGAMHGVGCLPGSEGLFGGRLELLFNGAHVARATCLPDAPS